MLRIHILHFVKEAQLNRIYLSYTKYVDNLPYYASSRLCRVLYFRNQISC